MTLSISDRVSGLPLRNAEVIDRSSGRSHLTGDSGTVHLDWRGAEPLPVRVRQVGYHFVDTVLTRSDPGGRMAIALSRVAYVLPALPVATRDDCGFGADTANALLAAIALDQLRMGAERYESFRRRYPFDVKIERRTTEFTPKGEVIGDTVRHEATSSDKWQERYRPGRIVSREPYGFSVPILFIAKSRRSGLLATALLRGHRHRDAEREPRRPVGLPAVALAQDARLGRLCPARFGHE